MALSTSKIVPTTNKIARELDEIYKDLHELDLSIQVPKILDKKESPQKEKQISVDPISLRESSLGEISFNMMLPPPPALLPTKHKFLSYSLPNSATSSPRFGSINLSRKNSKSESQASPRQVDKSVDSQFWRSKSCGDGRTHGPPVEVDDDLWLYEANGALRYNKHNITTNNVINNGGGHRRKISEDGNEVDFKCNALCLFLPGFIKAKQVRPRKEQMMMKKKNNNNNNNNVNVISRAVSLEKFECGSWASSTIIPDHDDGDGDSMNLYFDLPLELINNLGNDAHLPVSTAFVFDNKDVKGVLKNGSTQTRSNTGRKSHESSSSSRHVRFSTSSPTSYPASPASCITPRLRKARDEFNAFLEAQSA